MECVRCVCISASVKPILGAAVHKPQIHDSETVIAYCTLCSISVIVIKKSLSCMSYSTERSLPAHGNCTNRSLAVQVDCSKAAISAAYFQLDFVLY